MVGLRTGDYRQIFISGGKASQALDTALAKFMGMCRAYSVAERVIPAEEEVKKAVNNLWRAFDAAVKEHYSDRGE